MHLHQRGKCQHPERHAYFLYQTFVRLTQHHQAGIGGLQRRAQQALPINNQLYTYLGQAGHWLTENETLMSREPKYVPNL